MTLRTILTEPFAAEFFGGREAFQIEAGNLFALVRALDSIGPGFAEAAGIRAAVAVDGMHVADWSRSLDGASEVMFIPKIAGG